MVAIRAHFDGKKVIVPKDLQGARPGDVLVIFPSEPDAEDDSAGWLKAQEGAFGKAWDNHEDAIYDLL
jgi:hypothetical protein